MNQTQQALWPGIRIKCSVTQITKPAEFDDAYFGRVPSLFHRRAVSSSAFGHRVHVCGGFFGDRTVEARRKFTFLFVARHFCDNKPMPCSGAKNKFEKQMKKNHCNG